MYDRSRFQAPASAAKSPATLGVRQLFPQEQPTTGATAKHAGNRLGQWLRGGQNASRAGWKPYTMRASVLCSVVVISLALAGVLLSIFRHHSLFTSIQSDPEPLSFVLIGILSVDDFRSQHHNP